MALADLGLRSPDEVLTANDLSRENLPEKHNTHTVDPRHDRANPAAGTSTGPPTKAANAASGLIGLGATGYDDEAGLLSAAAAQSYQILGSLGAGGAAVSSPPSSPASSSLSLSGLVHGESLLSLTDSPLGEAGGGGGGGGGGGARTTYVDNFLAGFARAGGGDEGEGEADDGRPRRISSGGAQGAAGVVLSQHEEDVAAAWRAIGTEAADAGGRSEDRGSNSHCERGASAAAADAAAASPSPGYDPRSSTGEPVSQHQPLLQGSPLRPGGRAAVIPSARLSSSLSRPGAATSLVGDGSSNGLASGAEFRGGAAGGTEGEDRRNSKARNGAAVGAARGAADGTGAVGSPSASKAGRNIDRMMSSLLEEVLPARRSRGERSEKAAPVGVGNGGERSWTSERNQADAGTDKESARRPSSPRRHSSPSARATAAPPESAGRSGYSTPVSDGRADSSGSGFLTPIEVLMHAPPGGAGGRTSGCPSCESPRARSQSVDVKKEPGLSKKGAAPRTGAAAASAVASAAHRHTKGPRQAAQPAGEPRAPGQAHGRGAPAAALAAATPGVKDGGRRSASFSDTDDRNTGGGISRITSDHPRRNGQRFGGGNVPAAAGAAETTKKKPSRSSVDNGSDASVGDGGGGGGGGGRSNSDGGERSSAPAGAAGGAGSSAGALGELEAEVGEGAALMRRNHAALLRVVREQEDRGKQVRA